MLLQTHYKTQLNFTFQGLDATNSALQRLHDFIQRLNEIDSSQKGQGIDEICQRSFDQFSEALADDLNIQQLYQLFLILCEISIIYAMLGRFTKEKHRKFWD